MKLPKVPERLSSPFASALAGVKAEPPEPKRPARKGAPDVAPVRRARERKPDPKPAASAENEYRYEDRVAMSQAYRDVKPLGKPRGRAGAPPPRRVVAPVVPGGEPVSEARARERLAALVAGGIRFEVAFDEDGRVTGSRPGSRALADLKNGRARPEATLDLHGARGDEAEHETIRFVRDQERAGARVVCIVHGKGLHSEAGVGVLRDRVIHALTEGGAAPFTLAFTTASSDNGGGGALVVRLGRG